MSLPSLDENSLDDLCKWLSTVPLSKPIKNIAQDFSDGVLVAELIAHFLPRYVNLTNFTSVSSKALKRYNWETLNKMVFVHLNFSMKNNLIQKVASGQPGAIEFVLFRLREKIGQALQEGRFRPGRRRSQSAVGRTGSNLSIEEFNSEAEVMTRPPVHDEVHGNHIIAPMDLYHFRCDDNISILMQKYYQCQRNLLSRDEQIQKLYARIRHLERLSQLKEERIRELTKELDQITLFQYKEKHANLILPFSVDQKEIVTPPGSSDDQSFITSNSLSPRESDTK
ncbi:unnamed protein product [Thelazia callipaeda]|uniref:Calponin-homology (CH) domain-containing protein n=1 Tax=Thelazia callipaeda TaxID=103827 RepID=A0A0N5CLN4_THECL|nr:unnamed protein product [Thelazia callipaeda]